MRVGVCSRDLLLWRRALQPFNSPARKPVYYLLSDKRMRVLKLFVVMLRRVFFRKKVMGCFKEKIILSDRELDEEDNFKQKRLFTFNARRGGG